MIREQEIRTGLLTGEAGLIRLKQARVAVVGLGGVGGYALEALARAGVGHLTIVDFDTVQLSNINRQLIADRQSVGRSKTELFRQRIALIDPETQVTVHNVFAEKNNFPDILTDCDYLVDAIDSLEAKTDLLEYAYDKGLKTIAVFGAGNRLDASRIQVSDISKSHGCPLAKRVRKALRERGINNGIRVVFSAEEPIPAKLELPPSDVKRPIGSISYMPAIMGLRAAAELIRIILSDE